MKLSKDFILGFFLALIIVVIPAYYYFGKVQPEENRKKEIQISELQKERDQVRRDLEKSKELSGIKDTFLGDFADVGDRFNELYQLCEEKYQLGINGDLVGALEVKGKMTQIEEEIAKIFEKYSELLESDVSLL